MSLHLKNYWHFETCNSWVPSAPWERRLLKKICAAPKESMFPSTHFKGAKENNGKEGTSRREELAIMEHKRSTAALKAQHWGRIQEHPPQEREGGFHHCWVSSVFPFPSKNVCHDYPAPFHQRISNRGGKAIILSSQVIWSQRLSHRPHEEGHVLHRTWCSNWIGLWVVSPKTGLRCHICVKKE